MDFIKVLRSDFQRHRGDGGAFIALLTFRLGNAVLRIQNRALRWLPWKIYRIISILVSSITKIWLEPGTKIGEDFHIIHSTGFLAVHPDVVIGDRCGLMHNVTIGVNMTGGVPRIGDDVFIGANATVLGPIVIGDRVRIGANALVVTDVPADAIVQAPPARIIPKLGITTAKVDPTNSESGNS